MTSRRRALDRLARRVREVAPDIAAALLKAVARLSENVPITTIERALTTGGVEAVIAEIYSDATLDGVMAPARAELLRAVEKSGNATFRSAIPGGSVGVSFDVLAPQVLQAIDQLASVSLGKFRQDIQDAVRAEARAGLIAGEGPRTTARRIRASVGLAPNQQEAVRNFSEALASGDYTKALGYKLRDRRFDPVLKRLAKAGEPLTAGQIERFTAAYRRRFVAFHAQTIARTTALESLKLGQQLAVQQAADAGLVDPSRMVKTWITTMDGRERPEHAAMNGTTQPYNQPWDVPGEGLQDYPGQNSWNCRCSETYRLLPRTATVAA